MGIINIQDLENQLQNVWSKSSVPTQVSQIEMWLFPILSTKNKIHKYMHEEHAHSHMGGDCTQ